MCVCVCALKLESYIENTFIIFSSNTQRTNNNCALSKFTHCRRAVIAVPVALFTLFAKCVAVETRRLYARSPVTAPNERAKRKRTHKHTHPCHFNYGGLTSTGALAQGHRRMRLPEPFQKPRSLRLVSRPAPSLRCFRICVQVCVHNLLGARRRAYNLPRT